MAHLALLRALGALLSGCEWQWGPVCRGATLRFLRTRSSGTRPRREAAWPSIAPSRGAPTTIHGEKLNGLGRQAQSINTGKMKYEKTRPQEQSVTTEYARKLP